jgi:SulP family sulfate permease
MTMPAASTSPSPRRPSGWALFVPKLVTVLREGYGLSSLRADALAGLTVAIVALPLSMALAIASGAGPEKGLITAIVAGFLISALGGSRFQIGGPTGAFVVLVYATIQKHGYDGLVLATLMAGALLVVLGLARVGTFIKYIPYPVVTGFTSGIALIIFSSQVKDLLGLDLAAPPAALIAKWQAMAAALPTADGASIGVAGLTLGLILVVRRLRPTAPAFLVGISAGAVAVWAFGLPVETIGDRFGALPRTLPLPSLPEVSVDRMAEVLPAAITIALLAGIESLLSAVVGDGMTGRKHRSNCELVGQGVANMASALFGGLPATGAIARTATNIRAGARSPVAGMLHAAALLLFMLVAAPLAGTLPLASLAAVLVVVAWNMSEHDRFRHILRAPPGDILVLLTTFALTVLVDLTVAIEVGVVMAAVLFTHRMARAVEAESGTSLIAEDVADGPPADRTPYRPVAEGSGVVVYAINGPFFFGVAARLGDVLDSIGGTPRVLVIDMTNVPLIDASAEHALEDVVGKCARKGIAVRLRGVRPPLRRFLETMGVTRHGDVTFEDAS